MKHLFGTFKLRLGGTHFLIKRLKNVRTVVACNITRVMNIVDIKTPAAKIRACKNIVTGADDLSAIRNPCAVKAIVPGLRHKSEAGAVALGVEPGGLSGAIIAMQAQLNTQGLKADGFLIEELIADAVGELLVGIRRSTGIGLSLTLAVGGTAVELLQDTATLILPAPRSTIEAAIKCLKLATLLMGYRGRPAPDLGITLDSVEALCEFAVNDPDVYELEINPLILTASRALVADAVLIMKG